MTKRRFLTAGIVLFASASLNYRAFAQSASYAGRPFVPNARPNANDPVAGFVSGFGRAQMVGESVVFVPMSGVSAGGVFRGRGGPQTKVAAPGTTGPDGNLLFFHDDFSSRMLLSCTRRAARRLNRWRLCRSKSNVPALLWGGTF